MNVNDPWDLAAAPMHVSDDPEPEPVPLQDHFATDLAPPARRMAARGPVVAVERCRMDGLGRHTYRAIHCPHDRLSDEQGKIMPRGWTVQGAG